MAGPGWNEHPVTGFQHHCPLLAADLEAAGQDRIDLVDGMVVLGQIVKGVGTDRLRAGMEMELVLETLYADEANDYIVWKWRPVAA